MPLITGAAARSRTRLAELARGAIGRGDEVDVQATVVQIHPGHAVAAHCVMGIVCVGLSLVAPLLGVIGLVAVAASVAVEAEGGRGWIRSLVPRSIGHNLLLWGPQRRSGVLVLAAAMDVPPPSRWTGPAPLLGILAPLALAVLAPLLGIWWPELASDMRGVAAIVLGLLGTAAMAFGQTRKAADTSGPLRALWGRLRERPLENLSVVIVLVQGNSAHWDGLQTFLLNYRRRVPPVQTRVVLFEHGDGPLRAVSHPGLRHPQPHDDLLDHEARRSGAIVEMGHTAAARATRLGWRAIGLQAAPDTWTECGETVEQMLRHLDEAAGES